MVILRMISITHREYGDFTDTPYILVIIIHIIPIVTGIPSILFTGDSIYTLVASGILFVFGYIMVFRCGGHIIIHHISTAGTGLFIIRPTTLDPASEWYTDQPL